MDYIITFFPRFNKQAVSEIKNIASDMKEKNLEKNISLITNIESGSFINELIKSSPIFIRHIMPVHKKIMVYNTEKDREKILEAVKEVCALNEHQTFTVQCRIINGDKDYKSKDIEVFVGSHFDSLGAVPVISDYKITSFDSDIISIMINEDDCFIGFSKASENLNSSADEYRVASRHSREISRAENKLKEAISKFDIKISGTGNALDMGAAPGGWTKVLADYGFKVDAVDPGDLKEELYSHTNITHHKARIENVVFDYDFEIITNDMNIDPDQSSEIMCSLAERLIDGGIAVLTLKLPISDVNKSINKAKEILEAKYEIVTIKNLTHNRSEVTALLRKK